MLLIIQIAYWIGCVMMFLGVVYMESMLFIMLYQYKKHGAVLIDVGKNVIIVLILFSIGIAHFAVLEVMKVILGV